MQKRMPHTPVASISLSTSVVSTDGFRRWKMYTHNSAKSDLSERGREQQEQQKIKTNTKSIEKFQSWRICVTGNFTDACGVALCCCLLILSGECKVSPHPTDWVVWGKKTKSNEGTTCARYEKLEISRRWWFKFCLMANIELPSPRFLPTRDVIRFSFFFLCIFRSVQ